MLIDLTVHEKLANVFLRGLMDPFGPLDSPIYGCPLLHWTIRNKTTVEGVLVLHEWWKTVQEKPKSGDAEATFDGDTMEGARNYIKAVAEGTATDRTLSPILKKNSMWMTAIEREDGWIVTNSVWGQRPVEKMLNAHYQAGFLNWGQVVRELISLNPHLKIVLAGAWARTTRMKSGEEYSARKFYELWNRWLQNVGSAERKVAAYGLLRKISDSKARFFTRDHPSARNTAYGNYSPPPE
jgi:hypothetical protein